MQAASACSRHHLSKVLTYVADMAFKPIVIVYMSPKSLIGFTLAELLIALAILGAIATFTIPKILAAQRNQAYNSAAKEAIGAVSSTIQKMRANGTLSINTTPADVFAHINYVSYDTSSLIDSVPGSSTFQCVAGDLCIHLHNGAVLMDQTPGGGGFSGSNTTDSIQFAVDPDGQVTDGTTNGPGKSLLFVVYYHGLTVTYADKLAGTKVGGVSWGAGSASEMPSWFNW